MDVREIEPGRGAVHAAPRPGRGQAPTGSAPAPRGDARPPAGPSTDARGPTAVVFDANGDGVIESWSFAHGGDSFANFAPPPSGASGSNGTSAHHTSETHGRSDTGKVRGTGNAHAGLPVSMHHARNAYQRDGAAPAPSTPAAAAPPPVSPAPAPASTGRPSSPPVH